MATEDESVILVDTLDNEIGVDGKMAVHRSGKLHRAVSVFVFDSKDRLLLQKRASSKYHSGGLWSNTCCTHPRPGENQASAARRRLQEEMGIDCALEPAFSFVYRAALDNELIEHEYDHVFFGTTDDSPRPDPSEVEDWKLIDLQSLKLDIENNAHLYTIWFLVCFERVLSLQSSPE